MTKTLIILDNQEFEKYRDYIENRLNTDEEIKGITLGDTIPESELKEKINIKKLSDYDNFKTIFFYDEAYKFVKSLEHIKINGTKLVDVLKANGISYWEMIEPNLAPHITERIKIIQSLILMRGILSKENPNFVIFSDKTIYGKALKNILNSESKKNINLNKEIIDLEKLRFKTFYFLAGKAFRLDELYYQIKNKIKSRKAVFGKNKIKIAVFIQIPTNIPVVMPIIKELKNRNEYEVGVFYYETEPLWFGDTKKILRNNDIGATSVKEYFSPYAVRKSKEDIKKIESRWKSITNKSKFKEKIKFNDVPIYDMMENVFSYYFDMKRGRGRIIDVVKNVYYTKELIEKENPDLVLTLDAGSEIGGAMGIFPNAKNIPVLCLQHGMFTEKIWITPGSFADKELLWGGKVKEFFINAGYDKDKLEVVGCPTFDMINEKKKQKSSYIYKKYGINHERDIFIIASEAWSEVEGYVNESEKLFKIVFNAMKYFPDKLLIIKLHPREYSIKPYKKIANEVGIKNILITKNENLYELLAICKLLVIKDGTVGLEGILFDKPVITVNPGGENIWSEVAITVSNTEELVEAIKNILNSKGFEYYNEIRNKFIEDYAYKIDGKSTERIIKLMKRMVKDF